jgi:N utilization substance protein B
MGSRRKSRELAMQALFDMDMSQNDSDERLELFCQNFNPSSKILPFFQILFNGVKKNRKEIDALIERFSSNWKISRISCVDRNIMRVAVYEMLFCEDIPPKVTINEAIEIGKKFGAEDSGAFINGILDSIRIMLETNNKE